MRTVHELGEEEVLARVLRSLAPVLPEEEGVIGPGDDAAVLPALNGPTVISTDTAVIDQDFRLQWPNGYQSKGREIAWKVTAQNLSDINAMGAVARGMLLSLTLPGETPVTFVEDLAIGFAEAIKGLDSPCRVLGGDLSSGREISITATVFGELATEALLRSGAQAGDVVALSGDLGKAAAGWALLDSSIPFTSLGEETLGRIQDFHHPKPPLRAGPRAAQGGATAAIDISDGLLKDARRLAVASGVVLNLNSEYLQRYVPPLLGAAQCLARDPMEWVLGGGEDYGFLATFPPQYELPDGFLVLGTIELDEPQGAGVLLDSVPHQSLGWDTFSGLPVQDEL